MGKEESLSVVIKFLSLMGCLSLPGAIYRRLSLSQSRGGGVEADKILRVISSLR